jgi:acetyl esterase/lipase
MISETINFTSDGRVKLQTYIHPSAPKPLPAIIVLPGGAYGFISETEGEPVAKYFFDKDFHTFVLHYSVGNHSAYPAPLLEVSKAIWQVRKNATAWGIQSDGIALMGFSAGSGISAMSATQWNNQETALGAGANSAEDIRPNAAVIGYGASDNSKTIINNPDIYIPPILGKIALDKTPELDVVNYVSKDTSPMFIWHCRYDNLVPAINPIMMAESLQKNGCRYELHIFQQGQHGLGLGKNGECDIVLNNPDYINADLWVPMCINWLRKLFEMRRTAE